MSMRMAPAVAQQAAFPNVNRTSLVLFAGAVLIILNFLAVNGGGFLAGIFKKGATAQQPAYGYTDVGWQIVGLALLTIMAEYGGDAAGSAALLFLAALWLLWLVVHFGNGQKSLFPPAKEAATQPKE